MTLTISFSTIKKVTLISLGIIREDQENKSALSIFGRCRVSEATQILICLFFRDKAKRDGQN